MNRWSTFRPRLVRLVGLSLVVALATTGCGGGDDNEAVTAAPGVTTAPAETAAAAAPDTAGVPTAPDATAPDAAAQVDAGAASAAPAATTGAKPGGSKADPAGGTGKGDAGGKASTGGANAACTKPLSPIVIGQVGTFSGLVGQSVGGMKPGLAVWAQAVNATGGVQCHPVQVIAIDDQNDPQKAAAAVEDLIANRKVQAIVGANVPLTISGLVRSLEKYKFPAIGGDGIDGGWQEHKLLFPQGGTPLSAFGGAPAAVKLAKGFTKVALMYCAEAAICTLTNSSAKAKGGIMELAGVTLTRSEQVTLTQPDYTAACQNAKASGAEFIMVLVDAAAMRRVARSCASINYKVPIAGTAIDFTAESPNDPNLSGVGVYASAPVAPFPATDTPAMKAFHEAYAKYLPGQGPDESAIEGWSAGKLFEAAVGAVATKARAGDVTTPLIYEGLYALKNETMGALGPGVTFVKDGLPKLQPCYYVLTIKDGSYQAPHGSKKFCFARDPAKK